jgi:hypothetical protein
LAPELCTLQGSSTVVSSVFPQVSSWMLFLQCRNMRCGKAMGIFCSHRMTSTWVQVQVCDPKGRVGVKTWDQI